MFSCQRYCSSKLNEQAVRVIKLSKNLNGFYLQKYEMIKTEDIPHLENSTFSTRVVKDIAQNILSFLKSNCTKEGHTYWLFKGENQLIRHCPVAILCGLKCWYM